MATLIREAEGRFDCAFVDANKEDYDDYYEATLRLVRPGGLIVIDNTLFHGSVLMPDSCDARVNALRNLNAKIACDTRVDRVMLAAGDGMTMVRVH